MSEGEVTRVTWCLINVLCVIMRPEEEYAKHNAAGQGVTGEWRYRPPVTPGTASGKRRGKLSEVEKTQVCIEDYEEIRQHRERHPRTRYG